MKLDQFVNLVHTHTRIAAIPESGFRKDQVGYQIEAVIEIRHQRAFHQTVVERPAFVKFHVQIIEPVLMADVVKRADMWVR